MEHVTVLGLGRMGLPIAQRLVVHTTVTTYDPDPSRSAAAVAAGVRPAPSSRAAVAAGDIVMTVLTGAAVERDALLGPDGALASMRPGQLLLQLTSGEPGLTDEIARVAGAHGIDIVAAPMAGGPDNARDGTLGFFVGGANRAVARAMTVIDQLADASRVQHIGTTPSAAQSAKLVVNGLWFGQAAMAAQTLLVGAKLGIDPRRMLDVLSTGAASSELIRTHMPSVLRGDYLETFGLREVVEELDAVAALSTAHAVPGRLLELSAALHRDALAMFGAVDGELRVVEYLERLAGLSLRNPSALP